MHTTALKPAKLNSDSKKDERRLFYSSLDYNTTRIVNFGKILTQLYKQHQQEHHQLIKEIIKNPPIQQRNAQITIAENTIS
ncbi:complement regulator-acquiring protein [Borreliella tanukii]|uniref:complement regulator-acquiring protein n=1 Tax=Borreliella tanukii TaxID=56146 RepID=UPI003442B3BD